MFQARAKNAGWRIDYFVVSECLKDRLADAKIHTEILGSDHCPIELDLKYTDSITEETSELTFLFWPFRVRQKPQNL